MAQSRRCGGSARSCTGARRGGRLRCEDGAARSRSGRSGAVATSHHDADQDETELDEGARWCRGLVRGVDGSEARRSMRVRSSCSVSRSWSRARDGASGRLWRRRRREEERRAAAAAFIARALGLQGRCGHPRLPRPPRDAWRTSQRGTEARAWRRGARVMGIGALGCGVSGGDGCTWLGLGVPS